MDDYLAIEHGGSEICGDGRNEALWRGADLSGIRALAGAVHSGYDIVIGYPVNQAETGEVVGVRSRNDCIGTAINGGAFEIVSGSACGRAPIQ